MDNLEKHEYYYKTVEEAHRKFIQLMKVTAVDSERPLESVDIPGKMVWTDFLSESANEYPSEAELTDEMKETIALANRERFDPIIQMVCQFGPKYFEVRKILERVNATMQKFQNEINKFESIILDLSPGQDTELPGLLLTDDELYAALLMLEPTELRNVLPSNMPVSTYTAVLKSIQSHDRILFNAQLSELQLSDFRNLRAYLSLKIENASPYSSFFASLVRDNSPLFRYIISEVANDDETLLDEHESIMSALDSKDILVPKVFESYAQKLINFHFRLFFSSQDMPLILKRKAMDILKEWNDGLLYNAPIESDLSNTVQFRVLEMLIKIRDKWIVDGLRQRLGNEQPDQIVQTAGITEKETLRLPFPSRIEYKIKDPSQQNAILSGLFNEFGRFFESKDGVLISQDDFLYLFSGRITRPLTYHPPYYWNQADKYFAGLVRLLYFGQPTGFDDFVLLVKDKGLKKSSVKWSSRKQGLGKTVLKPIEEKIQNIVFEATGLHLPEVDLTKQNKPKNKKDEETKS